MRATPDGPRYTEKGSTDHTGVVAGGRFVRVELKTCSHPKMYLRQHVKPHQAAALDRALDFGGLAFLLVLFDRDDPLHWHRYDWRQVRGQTAVEADAGSVVDTVFLEDCVEGVTAWADREAADQ
ncbi:MAG: Holliday junction resolvase RecU [Lentisphaeria bacterium]